jgi:hypothetical protein
LRVVTRLPLEELWNDEGPVAAARGRDLAADDVRTRLREDAHGVIATIGAPLRWLHGVEFFDWWKSEAKPRLIDPEWERWRLADLPDERAWLASEWMLANGATVVSFEERH